MAKEAKKEKASEKNLVGTSANQAQTATRGRTFEGFVTKKFPKRVVIEFERKVFVPKYERFYKKKTRLHARLSDNLANEINIGDYVKIRETRPLSKIIHFIVLEKIRAKESKQ
ncbi:30S ribosomal protein S17 [Candidatus Pacearchaeota archaeon]|nr:30S ribosomal protein S17 [Candidatus Pacearchaeota archaeon]